MSTLALVEPSPEPQPDDEQKQEPRPNKYKYPEFAGPVGEERLHVICQRILPMALWRTWRAAVSFQAPGGSLYVGVERLTERVRPGMRKVYLDLQALEANGLLRMTPTRLQTMQTDGSFAMRPVIVKDFSPLYDLAHEYFEWISSPDYIPPEREFVALIRSDQALVEKLVRFDNYRRLLVCQKPGRKPKSKEGDWDGLETSDQGVGQGYRTPDPKVNLYLNGLAKGDSPKRINNDSPSNNPINKDSFDSELPSEKGEGLHEIDASSQKRACSQEGYTKRTTHSNHDTQSPTRANLTNPPSPAPETGRPKQSARRESAELEPAVRLARQAMALAQGGQPGRTKRKPTGDGKPRPKPNALVSSFLSEIGPLFHDKNLKGSITRALRIVQGFGLTIDTDILTCLVRAYKVARDTRTVREAHQNEDGSTNRMPLFLSMLRTFAEACAQGKSRYSGEDLVADIAEDDRLVLWLSECGLQLEVLSDPAAAQSEELTEAVITPDDDQEVTTASETGETEASLPQKEVSMQEQQSMQVTRRIRTAEEKQARAAYAREVRAKLRKGGVSEMLAAMVDTEHPCGCPLYWNTENTWKWKCAYCDRHPAWSKEVHAQIDSILEH